MKKTLCLLFVLLLTIGTLLGCQKPATSTIVVGKNADGWHDAEIEKVAAINGGTGSYEAPARYEKQVGDNNTNYNFHADITVPNQKMYPVYIVEPTRFTQEQADNIMSVLLEGQELYEETYTRTKNDVQNDINYYTRQLEEAQKNAESNQELISTYKESIAELTKEFETAPEDADIERTIVSKTFSCKPDQMLLYRYGEEIVHEDGGVSYEWNEEAQMKAQADGNESIGGNVTLSSGRKMYLSIKNSKIDGNSISFSEPDDVDPTIIDADYSLDEAVKKGNSIMSDMGIDAALVAKKERVFDGDKKYYRLEYKLNIPNTTGSDVVSMPMDGNVPDRSFTPPLYQEQIVLQLDGKGIMSFSWTNPIKVKTVDSENTQLIAWEDMADIIEQTLKVKTTWGLSDSNESVISRRVEIDKIVLSYMQVRKGSDLTERYYIPVWDVCGRIYEKYPTNIGDVGYPLDENGEADIFRELEEDTPISLLTINAIDGSVIDRVQGF